MRKIWLLAVLLLLSTIATKAQDSATQARLQQVLKAYYNVKEALVAGNKQAAAEGATSFIRHLNSISYTVLSEGNVNTLLTDAATIADGTDVEGQRAAFANFSANMVAVAKALKLSDAPVYIQYCPMKDASWLSDAKEIRNPYYGSQMLGCGNVTETIQ